jgi:hypothetical protein
MTEQMSRHDTMCDPEFNLKRLRTARCVEVKVKCTAQIVQVFIYNAYVKYIGIQMF